MHRSSNKETRLEGVSAEPRISALSSGETLDEWTTTRPELWSYYLYYVGKNELSDFNPGPSQFQNLLFLVGYDPIAGPGTACSINGCVLPYLGKPGVLRYISSNLPILSSQFDYLACEWHQLRDSSIFIARIGAWADYGRWRSIRRQEMRFPLNSET
ncbi:hypothetical protein CVT25_008934 [Psilocybe cyanescens]|uniref:Uncharacterized protein n=1 Tax=Psilocybe cyanescens TaxID=93625 RepID=A0A409XN92_PSICY|nr:hypothetical protein CVT25_008934 [Psilocybe cyanescens]